MNSWDTLETSSNVLIGQTSHKGIRQTLCLGGQGHSLLSLDGKSDEFCDGTRPEMIPQYCISHCASSSKQCLVGKIHEKFQKIRLNHPNNDSCCSFSS